MCSQWCCFSSRVETVLNYIALSEKFYATTAVVYFCFNCRIISDQFQTIDNQIKKWSISNYSIVKLICPKQLIRLQKHHALICHSVKLLNKSFGMIVFLEILFVFIVSSISFVRIITFLNASEFYKIPFPLIILSNMIGNLVLICHFGDRVHSKVRT